MESRSSVLVALAKLYAASKAGRTGAGQRDILVDFKDLLSQAGCQDGEDRDSAIRQLRKLDGSILFLEGPRRDSDIIHQVRLPPSSESKLFSLLGIPSPTNRRETLARQFSEASRFEVPEKWRASWQTFCSELSASVLHGGAVAPFAREDLDGNAELLHLIPRLLMWQQQGDESLLRFASCVLTGNSKRLGDLAAEGPDGRLTGKVGAILERVTSGEIRSLQDVGISQSPRFALVHGPLRLRLDSEWLDLGLFRGPVRLSGIDIGRALDTETSATRCLTVENETSFHELVKLNSGELLVCTGYPGSATLSLLRKLPSTLEFWHFGDSDPTGFDILRDLRERSGQPFRALHMKWRPVLAADPLSIGDKRLLQSLLTSECMKAEHEALRRIMREGTKGNFEQESLGRPEHKRWPFYNF